MAKLEEFRNETKATQDVVEVNQSDENGLVNHVTNDNISVNTVSDDSSSNDNLSIKNASNVNEAGNNESVIGVSTNVDSNLMGLFRALTLPQTKVRQYEGDPLYYHAFITSFHNTVAGIHDDNMKLNSLLSLCSGKALESIQYCVLKPPSEGFKSACRTLKERFGNTAVIVQAWIGKVLNRPRFDSIKLGEFSDDLENCFEALSALGYLNELNNQGSLRQIIEKLPRFLQNRWQSENFKLKEKGVVPGLENVMKFVKASAREINDPVFGSITNHTAEGQPPKQKRNQQIHNVKVNVPSQTAQRDKCWICKSDTHWPDQCEKFTKMKVEERFKMVKENHACFSCLKIAGRNHRINNCTRKKVCGEQMEDRRCDRFHHKLLHLTKSVGVNNVHVRNFDEPLLCVLEVEVIGKEESQTANVMLDLGSQGTFVRTEFANKLGVKGKSVSASITKFGGVEESFQSRICELKLRGTETKAIHNIRALEMPTINEVGEVNVEKLEEHFRLNNKLKRRGGPVDILIGVDYAYLMTGETKKSDGLVALNSPLGWAIFGSNGNTEMVNRVMHVKVDKPVNLDDFWTVESMGVDVGNCDCKAKLSVVENMEAKLIEESSSKVGNQWLIPYPWAKDPMHLPNNKVQATKMLNESNEKRLNKQIHIKLKPWYSCVIANLWVVVLTFRYNLHGQTKRYHFICISDCYLIT
ncbi:uncharacterized protein LOC117112268 [Anneissia japonica]|uniref:uncharacterized protein LOC117112268 n=1 Tax=Anneissia japonica TaxID=1529436 RepID=UPI001425A32F|nr:uncharacterized protein LOC117112268 [Anneissia japonica]